MHKQPGHGLSQDRDLPPIPEPEHGIQAPPPRPESPGQPSGPGPGPQFPGPGRP